MRGLSDDVGPTARPRGEGVGSGRPQGRFDFSTTLSAALENSRTEAVFDKLLLCASGCFPVASTFT
jgi:hypothetical protein